MHADPLSRPGVIQDQPRYLTDDSIVKSDVGYERLLFIHLNRIAERSTFIGVVPGAERAYLMSVEHLDAFMHGDKDDQFRQEMVQIRQSFMHLASRARASPDEEDDSVVTQRYAIAWLKCCMSLMKRKGYTPRTQTTDTVV